MDFPAARQNMVESQVRVNDVTDVALQKALRLVERERLCAPMQAFCAYGEVEVEVGPGRRLMQVRDLSKLLQALAPKPGERALGLAAPYGAAVLGMMGLETVAQETDSRTVAVIEPYLTELGVKIVTHDISQPHGQFDLIIVEGAVGQIPEAWTQALKIGGRLGVVIKTHTVGKAVLVTRYEASVSTREIFDSPTSLLKGFEPESRFVF
jgi:protein-L-isoaspartate(D-aspartate) O-methyltransferase